MKFKKKVVEEYRKCFLYIKSLKNYYIVLLGLFLAALVAAFAYPQPFQETLTKYITEILKQTENLGIFGMFLFLFKNNISTAFFGIVLGIGFGLFPLMSSIMNGYVLGFVLRKSADVQGLGVAWKILPHGIFELPAFFLSISIGLKLGMFMLAKKKREYLAENIENGFRVFLWVIFPLLIIAGVIETALIFFLK